MVGFDPQLFGLCMFDSQFTRNQCPPGVASPLSATQRTEYAMHPVAVKPERRGRQRSSLQRPTQPAGLAESPPLVPCRPWSPPPYGCLPGPAPKAPSPNPPGRVGGAPGPRLLGLAHRSAPEAHFGDKWRPATRPARPAGILSTPSPPPPGWSGAARGRPPPACVVHAAHRMSLGPR